MTQSSVCLVWLVLNNYFLLLRDAVTESITSSSQLFAPTLMNIFFPAFALALLMDVNDAGISAALLQFSRVIILGKCLQSVFHYKSFLHFCLTWGIP